MDIEVSEVEKQKKDEVRKISNAKKIKKFNALLEAVKVASEEFEKEKSLKEKNSAENGSSDKVDVRNGNFSRISKKEDGSYNKPRLSKQERLMREQALKKPVVHPVNKFKREGFKVEKLFSAVMDIQRERMNGLKKRFESKEVPELKKLDKKCLTWNCLKRNSESSEDEDCGYESKKQKAINGEKQSSGRETSGLRSKEMAKKEILTGPNPPPDLPEEFKNRIKNMGGYDIKLVIQKHLYESDLKKGQNRFSIPHTQIKNVFLNKEEENALKSSKIEEQRMQVELIEPSLQMGKITLRRWDMRKNSGMGKTSSSYVLMTTWNSKYNSVVDRNKLKENDLVQLWSFRVPDKELRFALVKVNAGQGGKIDCSKSSGEDGGDGGKTSREGSARISDGQEGKDGAGCSNGN